MSEKLDGVRAYWDGKSFWSRLGGTFHAPEWFTKDLPKDTHLDGELFGGRGKFQSTVGTVKTIPTSKKYDPERWRNLVYKVFDSIIYPAPFEDRQGTAKRRTAGCEYASVLQQILCTGVDHLRDTLAIVEAVGGEGLMLRQPGSLYERKRSSTLLKVKTFHDAEAVVIGHDPGKGKHKGRLGALQCRAENGAFFGIGTGFTDAEREAPPNVGATVTYRFQELTLDGVPRFPVYVRERTAGL